MNKALILCALVLVGWPHMIWAAAIAEVNRVVGVADVQRGGASPTQLRIGEKLFAEDIIRTKPNSQLQLTFVDGSRLTLAEKTRVDMERYRTHGKPEGLLSLGRGKLRAFVSKLFSSQRDGFRVRTPTAIAGVRGTDFMVLVQGRHTQISVFTGVVAARNIDPSVPGVVVIEKGQTSIVEQGVPPSEPTSLGRQFDIPPQKPSSTEDNGDGDGDGDGGGDEMPQEGTTDSGSATGGDEDSNWGPVGETEMPPLPGDEPLPTVEPQPTPDDPTGSEPPPQDPPPQDPPVGEPPTGEDVLFIPPGHGGESGGETQTPPSAPPGQQDVPPGHLWEEGSSKEQRKGDKR